MSNLTIEQETLFDYAIKYLIYNHIIKTENIEKNFMNYVVIQTLFFDEFIELHLDELANTVFKHALLGTNLVLALNEIFNFRSELYELYSETTEILKNLTTNEIKGYN